MKYQIVGRTDTGPVRQHNEDHILLGRFVKNRGTLGVTLATDDDFLSLYGFLCVVADGIGGAAAGEIASRLCLSSFDQEFYSMEKTCESDFTTSLAKSGDTANTAIITAMANNPDWDGMGCTLAGICLMTDGILLFHAGDSRVYRFRNGCLKQLTMDDTFINLAIQAGRITQQEANESNARHIITNYVGGDSYNLHLEAIPMMKPLDFLLICSDGLHDLISYEELEAVLDLDVDIQTKLDALVQHAVDAGGNDNISVILIKAEE